MTSTTLTDKYVAATLRRVPEKQRPEIEKELRAAIADDVDGRVDAGATPATAEYDALKEMGDPYRLAASYTNRSLTLIGPDVYPAFVRSLKIVLSVSLPVVYVVLAIISFAQGKNVFASIFGPLGSTIAVGIYVTFAITVLFAIIERAQSRQSTDAPRLEWTPDALAVEIDPPSLTKWGDVVSQVVGAIFLVGFLLIDRFAPFVTNKAGHAIPVLNQQLWAGWIPILIALLVLAIALELVKLRLARFTVGAAIAETILGTIASGLLIDLLLTVRVVNSALVSNTLFAPGSWITLIAVAAVAIVWLSTTINVWRPSTRRPRAAA